MAIDVVEAILQRGPDQEIWWSRTDSDQRSLIEPGAAIVTLSLELVEGDNQFLIEIEALDHYDNYTLSIVRDTIPPTLTLEEKANRTSSLETQRVVTGTCERGASVMVWSDTDSVDFICEDSGLFEIVIGIPEVPGDHIINALSSDGANNENTASIEVLEQEWIDWALDDARASGPMLWWFSLAGLILILLVVVPTLALRKRRARKDRLLKHGPDIDEIMSEFETAVSNTQDDDESTE